MMGNVIGNLYAKFGAIWLEKQEFYGHISSKKKVRCQYFDGKTNILNFWKAKTKPK